MVQRSSLGASSLEFCCGMSVGWEGEERDRSYKVYGVIKKVTSLQLSSFFSAMFCFCECFVATLLTKICSSKLLLLKRSKSSFFPFSSQQDLFRGIAFFCFKWKLVFACASLGLRCNSEKVSVNHSCGQAAHFVALIIPVINSVVLCLHLQLFAVVALRCAGFSVIVKHREQLLRGFISLCPLDTSFWLMLLPGFPVWVFLQPGNPANHCSAGAAASQLPCCRKHL